MSIEAMCWVLDFSKSKGTDRIVLVVLARHCKQGFWTCYPSIGRIVNQSHSSETAVRRSLHNLVDLGELEIKTRGATDIRIRKDKTPNLYTLIHSGVPPAVGRPGNEVPPAAERGTAYGAYGVPPAEPNKELKSNRKVGRVGISDLSSCGNPDCEQGWVFTAANEVTACRECNAGPTQTERLP